MKTYLTIIFSIIFPIKIHHFSHDNPPHLGPLGRPDVEVGTTSYAKCGNVPTDISVMHMYIYIYILYLIIYIILYIYMFIYKLYIYIQYMYIYMFYIHVYVLWWVADICRPLPMGFPGTPLSTQGLRRSHARPSVLGSHRPRANGTRGSTPTSTKPAEPLGETEKIVFSNDY